MRLSDLLTLKLSMNPASFSTTAHVITLQQPHQAANTLITKVCRQHTVKYSRDPLK